MPALKFNFQKKADGPTDLQKAQYQYAIEWFKFSADQRHKMFNYMVVLSGVLFAAAEAASRDHRPLIAIVCCVTGVVFCFAFSRIDRRNRMLVWLAEAVLLELEKESLFRENKFIFDESDKKVRMGIRLQQEFRENRDKPRSAAVNCNFLCSPWGFVIDAYAGKHRIWFSSIIPLLFAALFISAAIIIYNIDCDAGILSGCSLI